jgi:hypothetical protein
MITAQVRAYLEIAAVIILGIGFALFVKHERNVGEQKIEASDAKALELAKGKADAETKLNKERAAKADAGADHDQKILDDYRAAHPDSSPVRLCHPDNRVAGVPKGGAVDGGAQSASPGSAPVREVQDGTPGPDIGPGLDALVQAAGRLAIVYADRQRR